MSESTIDDLQRSARIGFVTGRVPPLLAEDRIYHRAVLASWIEPECISQWMDDLGDPAGQMLADWAAERGPKTMGAAA